MRSLGNSVIVAGTTTVVALVIAIVAAYALARLDFRFKRLVMTGIIATSMFPVVALVVPLLKLFTEIGWINTYQAMILPSLSFALPLAVWNLTAFFRQMPAELEQAAMVDGCTQGQAFRRVILPLAAPGVFTTAIIVFVITWNEFLIALTMVNEKSDANRAGGDLEVRRGVAVRDALRQPDGGRGADDGPADRPGPDLPAAHRRRPLLRWREVGTLRRDDAPRLREWPAVAIRAISTQQVAGLGTLRIGPQT